MAHCFENDQLSEHVRSEVGGIICHRREFDWLTIVWWAGRIYPSGVMRGRRQGDLDTCHPRIKAADGLKYSVQWFVAFGVETSLSSPTFWRGTVRASCVRARERVR